MAQGVCGQQVVSLVPHRRAVGRIHRERAQPQAFEPAAGDGRRIEKAVQVGAQHPSVAAHAAVTVAAVQAVAAQQHEQGAAVCDVGLPHVDFVAPAGDAVPRELGQGGGLGGFEFGLYRQQVQAGRRSGKGLDPLGIVDHLSQHLVAAANAQQVPPGRDVAPQGVAPTGLMQPFEVAAGVLGAGQNHGLDARKGLALFKIDQVQAVDGRQRIEVGEIGDMRQPDNRHGRPGARPGAEGLRFLDHHCVLGFDAEGTEPRQHPEDRLAGLLHDPVDALLEQIKVATETVDDKAADLRLLGRRKAGQGPHDLGEDAAAVDIGHQHHGRPGMGRHAQVDDVAGHQVDLGAGTGTLHHHHVAGGPGRRSFQRKAAFSADGRTWRRHPAGPSR